MVSCALSDKLATFAVSYSPQILTDMKRFVLFTMLAGILASCNSTLSVDNTPVAHLDLNRYLGEWYEVARYDHSFERGMDNTMARYILQDDGKVMNADINGAANTGRKYDKRIFPEGMDCGYLYGTVKVLTYKDILFASRSRNKSNPGQTGQRASVCPVSA